MHPDADLAPGYRSSVSCTFNRICVYCGSTTGFDNVYRQATGDLARELVKRGIGIVYGGGMVGLMGHLADNALEIGGEVIGIVPEALAEREVAHTGLTELRTVASMHARKAQMSELSDGFIALPGGIGTVEELIEVFTWAQMGIHANPSGILNANGYYDHLLAFLDNAVTEGFMREENRESLVVASTASELLDRMEAFEAPQVRKWLDIEHM